MNSSTLSFGLDFRGLAQLLMVPIFVGGVFKITTLGQLPKWGPVFDPPGVSPPKASEARKASSLRSRVEWLLLGWNLGGSTPHLVLSENQAMDGTHMGPYLPYPPHL